MKGQKGFYFDQTRCTGCQACAVACKDWHDTPAGPSRWIRITSKEEGQFPHPTVSFLFHYCYHCADPACLAACPHDAISKREEDGIVLVSAESCVGKEACGLCLEACPYRAPQFRATPGAPPGGSMEKCDLCLDRWDAGKRPICVDSCPARALDAGLLEDLAKEYRTTPGADGFTHSARLGPSIIFRPKKIFPPE